MLAAAAAFAARGAGSCAWAQPKFSSTLKPVVEDDELRGRGVLLGARICRACNRLSRGDTS